jgi:hypothetical protein
MRLASCILIITTRYEGRERRERLPLWSPQLYRRGKVKVLTHRLRYIEPAIVPEFGEGTSSTTEAKQVASITQSTEEPIVVPKVPTVGPVEAKDDKVEEPKVGKTRKNAINSKPSSRGKTVEGAKGSCRNSQGEEDGQRAGCCVRDHKGLEPRSY